ncbi:MAG: DUF255 domain-containing protein [Bacteroidales bacterium]|nr:DUF255 domain-containing protein [Bacteroidales bacterium]
MKLQLTILGMVALAMTVHAQSTVKWYTIEEAFALSRTEPRKIVIDVYTDWCSWCKVMDQNTYSNRIIAEYLNSKFYPVKFNAEQKEDVVVNGTTYKFVANGSRGYHELAAVLLNGQLGYPSTVFLDEQTRMIQPVQGYLQPQQFDEIIRFIGEDHFRTLTWEEFQVTYVSPIAEIQQ